MEQDKRIRLLEVKVKRLEVEVKDIIDILGLIIDSIEKYYKKRKK